MSLKVGEVEVEDTFAELFKAYFARILITAASERWARIAAESTVGFGCSIILCPSEAGIERYVGPEETPDGRPGAIVQIWHPDREKLESQVLGRISQCAMTCPTTSVFDACEGGEAVRIGRKIALFGDGFQRRALVRGRRMWRIPVMEGEFLVEDSFGIREGVSGGNLIVIGRSLEAALSGAERAVEAIAEVPWVVTTFPGGVCRCGSKVGSRRYAFLRASTNEAFCPTLRGKVESRLPSEARSAYEIVINGASLDSVKEAMARGIEAAAQVEGILRITAANFGGKLGPYRIHLRECLR